MGAGEQEARKHAALRGLLCALPALSLGAVEAALLAREALARSTRNAFGGAITDDGFALGAAYVLRVCPPFAENPYNDFVSKSMKVLLLLVDVKHACQARWQSTITPTIMLMGLHLQVLHLDTAFDALQWFDAVRDHFACQRSELEASTAAFQGRSGLRQWLPWGREEGSVRNDLPAADVQNSTLLLAKVDRYTREFDFLENTVTCARSLFRCS